MAEKNVLEGEKLTDRAKSEGQNFYKKYFVNFYKIFSSTSPPRGNDGWPFTASLQVSSFTSDS